MMCQFFKSFISSFALFITLSIFVSHDSALLGDEIHLKNGNVMRGTILGEDEHKVRLRLDSGIKVTLNKGTQVKRIVRQDPYLYHLEQARNREQRGRALSAMEQFEKCLKLKPDSVEAQQGRWRTRLAAAKNLHAGYQYEQALRLLAPLKTQAGHQAAALALEKQINQVLEELKTLEQQALGALSRDRLEEGLTLFDRLYWRHPARRITIGRLMAPPLSNLGDRALLDEDFGSAFEYYEKAMELDPSFVALLEDRWVKAALQPAHDAYNKKDYHQALNLITNVLQRFPGNINARFILATVYHSQGNDRNAWQEYNRILGRSKTWVKDGDALRKIREQAQERYKTAITVDSLSGRSESWTRSVPGDFKEMTKKDISIYHHNEFVAQQVMDTSIQRLQDIHSRLTGETKRPAMDPPLVITIYRNEEEYQKATGQPQWTGGVTKTTGTPKELRRREVICFQTSSSLLQTVIPHELTHALLPSILGRGPGIPRWIEEGLAVASEPEYKQNFYIKTIKPQLLKGAVFPVGTLMAMTQYPPSVDVEVFYAQSWLLCEALIKRQDIKHFLDFAQELQVSNYEERLKSFYDIDDPEDLIPDMQKLVD